MQKQSLKGTERLTGEPGLDLDGQVLDFWQWAFGDLRSNDVRGVFAEWLVAQVLGIPSVGPRESWAGWDLMTEEGVRIEVKSGAYLQSWHTEGTRPSRIEWSRLSGRLWDVRTGLYASERTLNADLYVFCVQHETDPACWDALDLRQWRFYLLTREQVQALNVRTLSEAQLSRIVPALNAEVLRNAGRRAVADAARMQQ